MAGRTVVGLDIGTSAVRAAEVSLTGKGAVLEKFGQVALAPGMVRAGEVVDVNGVAAAIEHLVRQTKITNKKMHLGVANQKVVVRQVDLPSIPLDDLRASLALQVQDFVPMPVEEAVLDFYPVEEIIGETGARMLRVLLVAGARGMIESQMAAVRAAKLQVASIDLVPFAMLRSVGTLGFADGSAEALVDIGAAVTNIIVHQNGTPRFVRILPMGGDDITAAVSERVGVAHDAAEAMKVQLGLAGAGVESADAHPASRAIGSTVAQLVEEVRGSLDYYLAQPGALRLSGVVLSGGGGRLTGIEAWLTAATRLPVTPAEPLGRLTMGRLGLTPEQIDHIRPLSAVPIGLAMGAA